MPQTGTAFTGIEVTSTSVAWVTPTQDARWEASHDVHHGDWAIRVHRTAADRDVSATVPVRSTRALQQALQHLGQPPLDRAVVEAMLHIEKRSSGIRRHGLALVS